MDCDINELCLELFDGFSGDRREFLQRVKKHRPKFHLSRIGGTNHWQWVIYRFDGPVGIYGWEKENIGGKRGCRFLRIEIVDGVIGGQTGVIRFNDDLPINHIHLGKDYKVRMN